MYYAMGEILLLAVAVIAVTKPVPHRPAYRRGLLGFAVVLLAVAAVWRPYEALDAADAVENGRLLDDLRPLQAGLASIRPDHVLAGPLSPRWLPS